MTLHTRDTRVKSKGHAGAASTQGRRFSLAETEKQAKLRTRALPAPFCGQAAPGACGEEGVWARGLQKVQNRPGSRHTQPRSPRRLGGQGTPNP